jgi:hypothetical protein
MDMTFRLGTLLFGGLCLALAAAGCGGGGSGGSSGLCQDVCDKNESCSKLNGMLYSPAACDRDCGDFMEEMAFATCDDEYEAFRACFFKDLGASCRKSDVSDSESHCTNEHDDFLRCLRDFTKEDIVDISATLKTTDPVKLTN